MLKINPLKLGLATGLVLGLWHLCWATFVAIGWAQAVLNFILWMHFIKPVLQVGQFVPTTALVLIAVTSGVGFAGGFVLGTAWNWLHRADT